ncbi:MAG TPA: hypothetical protein VFD64_02225 [Gemmatimonadaceae bacterium]|nr:hypothetical protein [Gemmatimonadaceae bacterium]
MITTPPFPTAATLSLAALVTLMGVPSTLFAQQRTTPLFTAGVGRPTGAAATSKRASTPQGAANPRLLPDISVVGDLIADLSPDGTTQEDGSRLGLREVELAVQAAVDPTFRADVFLGFSDAEGVHIEQAFMTATSLPIEVRLGRFLTPFGKQNTTHRHDLHTIDHSLVVQRFLGEEGLKSTGLYLGHSLAPFGFFQELILTAADRLGEAPEGLVTEEPTSKDVADLAYGARLRNYWDLSEASNLEISGSVLTGLKERELSAPIGEVTARALRQTTLGADVTFRWRPPAQGLYKSFILQSEFMVQQNEDYDLADSPAPINIGDFTGLYVFGRYQVGRRSYLGARFDTVEDPEFDGERTNAFSGIWQFYPSEFSKLVAKFERVSPKSFEAFNRFVLQATFALGPHKPHPF